MRKWEKPLSLLSLLLAQTRVERDLHLLCCFIVLVEKGHPTMQGNQPTHPPVPADPSAPHYIHHGEGHHSHKHAHAEHGHHHHRHHHAGGEQEHTHGTDHPLHEQHPDHHHHHMG